MRLTGITCALVASLIIGSGNTFVLVAGPAKGAESGAISVTSDPVGATVYVDGQFIGQTPIDVPSLAAGDHRVRLVMDGYLENGRIVTVNTGKTETLNVRLSARAQDGAAQITGLKIVVLEGEDAVNIIDKKTAVKPTVEVRDKNDLPVSGAMVTFMINGGRNTATFANGLRQVTVTTGSLGRATTELTPVGKGAFQIEARAAYQGQTATATIHQSNFATAAEAAKAGKAPGQGGQSSASSGSSGTTTASAGAGAGAGTGGLSALAIGGIVGGAAAGTAVAVGVAKGGNKAPTVSGIAANPSTALLGTNTSIAFSVQASDQDNDQLTYSWDFGDGATSTQQSPTHVYNSAGSFTAKLTVNDGKASATSQTTVVVKSLSGVWRATVVGSVFGEITDTFTLTQSGQSVSGSAVSTAGPASTVTGGSIKATSPRVTFTVTTTGFVPFVFTGDPAPDVNTIVGVYNGSGYSNTSVTMTRQ
jgi:hypothetical protein